jgi:SAM-dependent methyltransferase
VSDHGHLNYAYLLAKANSLSRCSPPMVLDFGCGTGKLLEYADRCGFPGEMWGVDNFAGHWENWGLRESVPETVRGRVRLIEKDRIPFADASFDVVVANQVFEHIFQPRPVLLEIERVLKPEGAFLALFPTDDIWFEGHVGLYFVHWLQRWPRVQFGFCQVSRALGFGYYCETLPAKDWAELRGKFLREACVHHDIFDIRRWWQEVFGSEPLSLADDYMAWRLPRDERVQFLRALPQTHVGRAMLRFLCHKRIGRILVVRKGEK